MDKIHKRPKNKYKPGNRDRQDKGERKIIVLSLGGSKSETLKLHHVQVSAHKNIVVVYPLQKGKKLITKSFLKTHRKMIMALCQTK